MLTSIRKGEFKPIYVLVGKETYFIDRIIEALEKYSVSPEDKDFNYNLYYGNDTPGDIVVNCAQQFPVMAPRKLVIYKETQASANAKAELDKLVPYAGKPNQTTVLVVTYTGDKTAAIANLERAVTKSEEGIVFKSESPRDYQLVSHIKDYCTDHKIGIDDNAAEMLAEYVGAPLSKLFGEVSKLIMIVGPKGRITADVVSKNIGISKDFNNFELAKALSMRDYPKCMRIVNYFRNNPKTNPTIVTTGTIFNMFTRITIAHFLQDKSSESLMSLLGNRNKYALDELVRGMKAYPPVKAVNAIHYIREFDAKNKGINSVADEYDLLQELIFKIMT